jgi:spore germination protein (amino acid permease)
MKKELNEKFLVSPSLVFFLIHSIQIGVGILGYQRTIAESAGYDAWIGVLITGCAIHLIIWMMYGILKRGKGDLLSIHKDVFGKWMGGFLSIIWLIYFAAIGVIVLRTYIEVVQVWMFPHLATWSYSLLFLILVYYVVSGGFRVVTGICFLGVIIPFYLLLTFVFPLEFTNFSNLLPIWTHSTKEILLSAKGMTLSFLGFSTLFIYYPFIKQPEKSQKHAHLGHLLTTIIYLMVAIITFAYFSEAQLDKSIWATLTMWKIVEMPFVERFEYIGITSWTLVILPNICLAVWASSRGMKQLFKIKHRTALKILLAVVFVAVCLLDERKKIELISNAVGQFGFILITTYIPLLFIICMIRHKVRTKK